MAFVVSNNGVGTLGLPIQTDSVCVGTGFRARLTTAFVRITLVVIILINNNIIHAVFVDYYAI